MGLADALAACAAVAVETGERGARGGAADERSRGLHVGGGRQGGRQRGAEAHSRVGPAHRRRDSVSPLGPLPCRGGGSTALPSSCPDWQAAFSDQPLSIHMWRVFIANATAPGHSLPLSLFID